MTPRPAAHYGSSQAPFEMSAESEWGLSVIEQRALLVIVKSNGATCANLGAELWGRAGNGNCSCPWARPAGKVVKRLRELGLVRRDAKTGWLTVYRHTAIVERIIDRIRRRQ